MRFPLIRPRFPGRARLRVQCRPRERRFARNRQNWGAQTVPVYFPGSCCLLLRCAMSGWAIGVWLLLVAFGCRLLPSIGARLIILWLEVRIFQGPPKNQEFMVSLTVCRLSLSQVVTIFSTVRELPQLWREPNALSSELTCVPSSTTVARCLQIANCIRGGCSENGNPYFDGSASRLMQYRPNKK